MTRINKINEVISFSVKKDNISFLQNDKVFLNHLMISDKARNYVFISDDEYLFFELIKDYKTYFCDLRNLKIDFLDNYSLIFTSENSLNFLAFKFNHSSGEHKIIKFDFLKRLEIKELFDYPKFSIIYSNSVNCLLLRDDNIYVFYNHQTETTLWQYSVAEFGADKVSRILGVFGQVLVVVCEMPKNPIPILVGLNITDGSKLFTVQLPLYQMNNNLFFYEANNSIVSIIGEYLWEFCLSTFQVIREKYLPEVFNTEDVHIQVYLATLQGDSIYFAASEFGKSMSSAIVGIFDLKNEQLIDYIDLKPNGKFCMGGNSCPQVSGNKIYVLDTKKTLHILEREIV